MNTRVLHFTIGPIQEFIFQARRTRDLWGGSFMLSWLGGIAMKQVIKTNGFIVFPKVHDDEKKPTDALLGAIIGTPLPGNPRPMIGSLPTRFKAIVPTGFDPQTQIAEVVNKAFEDAAETVWREYLAHAVSSGSGTRAIWERQVRNFWEFAWVLGGNPGDGSDVHWLGARKNWCMPASTAQEGGDHCTVMHAWQELSGWVRAHDLKKQDKFWAEIRRKVGKLDLRPDERLCAIAFVKRMLPKLAREDEKIFGWKVDSRNWPSTAFMAAVPWIKEAWEKDGGSAHRLTILAKEGFEEGPFGERLANIECLKSVDEDFRGLDGNAFHWFALANEKTTPLKAGADREVLLKALKTLQEKVGHAASPFYALFLMDGDGLGSMLHDHPEQKVAASLATFTRQVGDIVSHQNGVTVYAGGDDVLAMLPLHDAITAACGWNCVFAKRF
jgi:CRISPR-associated protein Cmr2